MRELIFKIYRIYQVDAFTKEQFRGNPDEVVPNADGLTGEQMQNIARELNNSETAFTWSARSILLQEIKTILLALMKIV
ncbi:MAG: PhzF family phenazine biosynthesis protein [Ignavibacteriales bacterium]|nr:PhzF family phenazine biosynthesis protein [Ignavibacteriales bacterium]